MVVRRRFLRPRVQKGKGVSLSPLSFISEGKKARKKETIKNNIETFERRQKNKSHAHDAGISRRRQCQPIHITPTFSLSLSTPTTPQRNIMGCTTSRPRPHNTPPVTHTNNTRESRTFRHAPRYPQVPPGHLPTDCATCTHANRRFEQRCGDACTATRRSKMRCKWNPGAHPRRHSWEVYEEETAW